jgi:6,7-dimethyl-8-ribityllumazine synthase
MKEIAICSACVSAHDGRVLARPDSCCSLITRKTMNQTLRTSPTSQAAHRPPPRIAVVSSSWHRDIVNQALQGMRDELARGGLARSQIDEFAVPGAFEIPLHVQKLAQGRRHAAVIACGLVVNGGIYRHEFVAAAVIDGLMRVMLDSGVPVFSAVLTPRDFHDHDEHRRFFAEHFVGKGAEVARACLTTLMALPRMEPAVA